MKTFSVVFLSLFLALNSWAVSSTSIYNLESTWVNQDGKQVTLPSLQGRVRIMSMVFTQCAYVCPMIVGDIKMILSKLTPAQREKVSVDLFSFDYERDNPEALKAFTKKMKIDNPQWNLYTSSKSSIADLAGVLGVQYKKLEGGAYVHSTNIILIDKEGEILKTIQGYDATAGEMLELLKKHLGS